MKVLVGFIPSKSNNYTVYFWSVDSMFGNIAEPRSRIIFLNRIAFPQSGTSIIIQTQNHHIKKNPENIISTCALHKQI